MKVKLMATHAANKIQYIKAYRTLSWKGLKDSKDAVEAVLPSDPTTPWEVIIETPAEGEIMTYTDGDKKTFHLDAALKDVNEGGKNLGVSAVKISSLTFAATIDGNKASIAFKGDKIEAAMTVKSENMASVIQWVMDNFT